METVLFWAQTHWPYAALGIAAAALIALGIRQSVGEKRSSAAYLRHAISVNLGILRREHHELTRIASSHDGPDKVQAVGLLASVQTTLSALGTDMTRFSNRRLGNILGQVFAAMNKSANARRLLGACEPGNLE